MVSTSTLVGDPDRVSSRVACDPVEHGHPEVHQDHLGLGPAHHVDGLAPVGGRADHLAAAGLQDELEAGAHQLLVVGDDDARHSRHPGERQRHLEDELVVRPGALDAAAEEVDALGDAAQPEAGPAAARRTHTVRQLMCTRSGVAVTSSRAWPSPCLRALVSASWTTR